MILYRDAFYAFHPMAGMAPPGWLPVWWQMFRSRARFRHTSYFYYDAQFERWICVEWSTIGMFSGIIMDDELDHYVALLDVLGGEILRYKARNDDHRTPFWSFSYCVSGCKHLANLGSWAATPDQLFRALRRAGARGAFFSDTKSDGELDEFPVPIPAGGGGSRPGS